MKSFIAAATLFTAAAVAAPQDGGIAGQLASLPACGVSLSE